jgi:hypothetical protein
MKTGFRVIRFSLAVLVLSLLLVTTSNASTAGQTILAVSPTISNNCTSGQIAIRVENITDLAAYDVYLNFTPGVITVTDVENGGFLDEGLFAPKVINNPEGKLSFGLVQLGTQTPKTGSGELIIVSFTIVQQDQWVNFQIDADTDLVHAIDNAAIEYTIVNGTLSTSCQPPHSVYLPLIRR